MRSSGHGKGQVCESRGMALHVSSAIASVYRHDRLGLRRLTRTGSHENRRALLLTAASTALASVYIGRRRTRPVDSTATTCTRTVATRRTRWRACDHRTILPARDSADFEPHALADPARPARVRAVADSVLLVRTPAVCCQSRSAAGTRGR